MRTSILALSSRFLNEESGQDLIEYALLTAIITVSSILVFTSISNKMGLAYISWESTGQANWVPNDPS